MKCLWLLALSILVNLAETASSVAAAPDSPTTETPSDWKSRVEADWLRQDTVRGRENPEESPTTRDDAFGAVDGVKNGKWGFHTAYEKRPWWQVDLGRVHVLSRALLYNRCDGGVAARSAGLTILLSDDGRRWREVYRHDGTVFFGATDEKPLEVSLDGARARFLRVRIPTAEYLHLDEVEVYGVGEGDKNLALGKPADQSSVSRWSTRKPHGKAVTGDYAIAQAVERGRRLAADLHEAGVDVARAEQELGRVAHAAGLLEPDAPAEIRKGLYLEARRAVRSLAFSNPLLDFDRILFVKRSPGSFSHMSDQYYGWWSRPGGGLYILEGFKSETPRLRCLTDAMPTGSFLRPDLSYDGTSVLFAYCRYYPHVAGLRYKVCKDEIPEDAFYHVFEMNVDGTGMRQLTFGRYDDFDARYLPNGEIVFLSTRRGEFIQCGKASAQETTRMTLPDSYVRCGGDNYRPVSIYTLHVMRSDGTNLRAISPFENFEWTPSVANDGRVLYARWDYVDRDNMPFMSLWATHSDGTRPQIVYGNFTRNPHCVFEARSVPDSSRILFTASGHHSITAGSLVLLDPDRGLDGEGSLTRLTPEVCFPETEGWPSTYFANPYPLSETYYLAAWSHVPLAGPGRMNPRNALGLYLCDAFGNLELLHRDPAISSMYPLPIRSRPKPPEISSTVAWDGTNEGRCLLVDVYRGGLQNVQRGAIRQLRIVGVPAKTQPQMNTPKMGITHDDPGKFVLGTVPVEPDGSAYFRIPAGIPVFFQALDADGFAVQTMRTITYAQPNQTLSCIGCHEPRDTAPPLAQPTAALRAPSRIAPGPEGSWPLRYDRLVQPVLDRHCVSCHRPDGDDPEAARFDLTAAGSYDSLIDYGTPSLRDHVVKRYREGKSTAGACAARKSPLLTLLRENSGHEGVQLDGDSLSRLVTWMDLYAQRLGSFSADQEERLHRLRKDWAALLLPEGFPTIAE